MSCDPPPLGTPQLDPLCNLGTIVNSKFAEWQKTVEGWFSDALATMMRATATAWTGITTPGITVGDPKNGAPSATVGMLMNLTAYVSASLILVGIIWAMGRMAITQDPEHGKEAGKGFVRWIIVTGAAAAIVGTGVVIADGMSDWIIASSTGADFGAGLLQMVTDTSGLGFVLLIVMAIFGLGASVGQIVLLIWRGGALVVLTGVIGVKAAASSTGEKGKTAFQHACGWILAYLLYKPVAALFYAAAFKLMTTADNSYDDTKTIEHITGFALMFLALLALPAMLRLVTPLVSQVAGGKGMGGVLSGAAMVALPTGAMMVASKGAAGAAAGAASSGGGGNSGGGGGEASGAANAGGGGAAAPSSGGGQQLTAVGGQGGAPAPSAKNVPGGAIAAAFRGGTNPNAQPPTAKAV